MTTGSDEVSPRTADRGIDARRNARGIAEATAPRESGAAITSESKRASDFSNAASPIGSGVSQASTAAAAAFFAPSRWKFVKITARSMGAGGEDWKKPSGSSSSATITGALRRSDFESGENARSFHGSARVPFPLTKSGGFTKLRATVVKAARSSPVPGATIQTTSAAAETSSSRSRRWNELVTFRIGGSP